MRINNHGRRVSLRDEITDVISDQLPYDDNIKVVIDSFLNSKDMEKMLDGVLDAIEKHIDYNLDAIQILE